MSECNVEVSPDPGWGGDKDKRLSVFGERRVAVIFHSIFDNAVICQPHFVKSHTLMLL